MERNDFILILAVFVLYVASCVTCYKTGRNLERKALTKALIDSIDKTCDECFMEGGKVGFKQGKKEGLQTCDDVLSNLDDGGRR